MDKEKLQEMIDGIGAMSEIVVIMYKTMIENGLDTGEAVVLSQAVLEVILGQGN